MTERCVAFGALLSEYCPHIKKLMTRLWRFPLQAVNLMLSNHFQTLGEACRIEGLDPHQKYRAPVTAAHEVGWRAPSKTNKANSLELFGVAQHGRKDKIKTLFDMVP